MTDPAGITNPYWEIVRGLPGDEITLRYQGRWEPESYPFDPNGPSRPGRRDLTPRFAWAIPSPTALAWVVDVLGGRPVLDPFAGTGYWAWMLAQCGVDVLATDLAPPDTTRNTWHDRHDLDTNLVTPGGHVYYPVTQADAATAAAAHPDRALFICWPPYSSDAAARAVAAYTGDLLIVCGEGPGGCTGDDDFHALLGEPAWRDDDDPGVDPPALWRPVAACAGHVQWSSVYDDLTVYERVPVPAGTR